MKAQIIGDDVRNLAELLGKSVLRHVDYMINRKMDAAILFFYPKTGVRVFYKNQKFWVHAECQEALDATFHEVIKIWNTKMINGLP